VKEERFYELISRKLANEATIQELDELKNMVDADAELANFHNHLLSIDNTAAEKDNNTSKQAASLYTAHKLQMELSGFFGKEIYAGEKTTAENDNSIVKFIPVKSRKKYWYAAAAAACMVLVFFISSRLLNKPAGTVTPAVASNEVVTKKANKSKITLSDGTTVFLNSDSRLSYKNFNGLLREVYLTGEAFFEVAKDSLHPFIIHAENVNIKVLGTAFNVKAYPEDKNTETCLIHGLVEISVTNDAERKILLKPNEKVLIPKIAVPVKAAVTQALRKTDTASIYTISRIIPDNKDNSIIETAWMNNRLLYKKERLEDLAVRMERWFDVTMVLSSNKVKDLVFTGTLESQNIEQALQNLQFSCNNAFTFKINGNKVFIQPK
jgi:transmembrane sensor